MIDDMEAIAMYEWPRRKKIYSYSVMGDTRMVVEKPAMSCGSIDIDLFSKDFVVDHVEGKASARVRQHLSNTEVKALFEALKEVIREADDVLGTKPRTKRSKKRGKR